MDGRAVILAIILGVFLYVMAEAGMLTSNLGDAITTSIELIQEGK